MACRYLFLLHFLLQLWLLMHIILYTFSNCLSILPLSLCLSLVENYIFHHIHFSSRWSLSSDSQIYWLLFVETSPTHAYKQIILVAKLYHLAIRNWHSALHCIYTFIYIHRWMHSMAIFCILAELSSLLLWIDSALLAICGGDFINMKGKLLY